MADRANDQFNSVFQDILWVEHDGQGLDTVLRQVQDGAGVATIVTISTNAINFNLTGGGIFSINGISWTVSLNLVNALTSATFLTTTASGFPQERHLTAGNGITFTDGGPAGNFTTALSDNIVFTGNEGITLPGGTTGQRPVLPNTFELRGNSTLSTLETYVGGTWVNLLTGSSGAPINATYITQTPNATLTNEQALSALATGILKSTTATGVVSIAVQGTDYYAPGGTDVALADGGTNASLVASNGGIFYSTATAGAILAGTAAVQRVLLSGASTAPFWSLARYPDSTVANELLYSSGTNTIAGLATANNGILVTSAGGVPSISSTLPAAVLGNITTVGTITTGVWNGTPITVPYGGTGNTTFTAYSVICAGTTATGTFQNVVGVGTAGQFLTSSGAGALPVWSNTFVGSWVDQTGASVTMVANTNYIADNAGLVTLTLPAVAALGSTFTIVGKGAGGWLLAQAAGQQIKFGDVATTVGVGGSLASSNANDCISVVCVTADTVFVVYHTMGNLTYV